MILYKELNRLESLMNDTRVRISPDPLLGSALESTVHKGSNC